MLRILPFAIFVFLIWIAYRHIKKQSPKNRKSVLIKYAVYLTMGVLVVAVLAGRIHWLGAIVAGALGILKFGASNFLRFLPFIKTLKDSNAFGDPVFKTPYLEVRVNIKTGSITGSITAGDFQGRDILTLLPEEYEQLEKHLKDNDTRGYYLLRVIRQRMQGQHSGNNNSYDNSVTVANPSIDEARMMLGLENQFTKKDVEYSYKRLMQKLHPDRGGNDYLASRINIARDILIKHLNEKT